jgi:hypothetical protein
MDDEAVDDLQALNNRIEYAGCYELHGKIVESISAHACYGIGGIYSNFFSTVQDNINIDSIISAEIMHDMRIIYDY